MTKISNYEFISVFFSFRKLHFNVNFNPYRGEYTFLAHYLKMDMSFVLFQCYINAKESFTAVA